MNKQLAALFFGQAMNEPRIEFDDDTKKVLREMSAGMTDIVRDMFMDHMERIYRHKKQFDDVMARKLLPELDMEDLHFKTEQNCSTLH